MGSSSSRDMSVAVMEPPTVMKPLTEKKKLLIDADPGVDDAEALLMALADPNVEIVAITTGHGNTDYKNVARNTLRLLQLAERLEIPVYLGCQTALMGELIMAPYYHGKDGFGDVPDPNAPGLDHAQKEHAVNAIVRIVNEHKKGTLNLLCMGPLTNIALALRLDPTLPEKLQHCYIMGGNYKGKGNVTEFAEFNFYADPEAADVVLRELSCPITMACWELCLKSAFSWKKYNELRDLPGAKAAFLKLISGHMVRYCHKKHFPKYTPADQFAMACALDSSIVTKSDRCKASVDVSRKKTRGQAVIKYYKDGNIDIVKELDMKKYIDMLERAVRM